MKIITNKSIKFSAKIYLGFCDLDDPDKINWLLPFLFSAFNGRICRIEGYASIMANGPSVNVESCNVLNPKRFGLFFKKFD